MHHSKSNDDTAPSGDRPRPAAARTPAAHSASDTAVPAATATAPSDRPARSRVVIMSDAIDLNPPPAPDPASRDDDDPECKSPEDDNDDDDGVFDENASRSPTGISDTEKQRRRAASGAEIGAVEVEEEADQLNRRFYLGLDRASVRLRNALARRERAAARRRGRGSNAAVESVGGDGGEEAGQGQDAVGGGEAAPTADVVVARGSEEDEDGRRGSVTSAMSTTFARHDHDSLISATLVEEGEVVEARPLSFFDKKGKVLAAFVCLLSAVSVTLAVALGVGVDEANEVEPTSPPTEVPSMVPSSMPSFDPRPTLQIVQDRGHVLCGLRNSSMVSEDDFRRKLCRAVAAVLLGNPDSIKSVLVTIDNRFQLLNDRNLDLLLYGDAHTIERELREESTGVGFAFTSPYYYDSMTYFGNASYVNCADERRRHAWCSQTSICALAKSTGLDYVRRTFPSKFWIVGSTLEEATQMLLNGTCNVVADGKSLLMDMESTIGVKSNRTFVYGKESEESEPLAIVTRHNDPQFSDIINWVVQALFYGEEQGMGKNPSLCQNYTNMTTLPQASALNFLNAVHCVGSYFEVCGKLCPQGFNRMNNGSTGMLYMTPFGDMGVQDGGIMYERGRLDDIVKKGSLNCGVVVPDGFDTNIISEIERCGKQVKVRGLVGMSVDYCCTLGGALSYGDLSAVNFTTFSENDGSSFVALKDGTVDVLARVKVEKKDGIHFSTPYYHDHGNGTAGEGMSSFALATNSSEDRVFFSSFVNLIVMATFYAEENGINSRKKSKEMPLLPIFGSEFPKWALRDAIFYSLSYDELYKKHFTVISEEDRGPNYLNDDGGPQIYSFPGLSE